MTHYLLRDRDMCRDRNLHALFLWPFRWGGKLFAGSHFSPTSPQFRKIYPQHGFLNADDFSVAAGLNTLTVICVDFLECVLKNNVCETPDGDIVDPVHPPAGI